VAQAVAHGVNASEADGTLLYGLVAEFPDAPELIAAAERTRAAGFRKIDGYAPFPVEGLSEALGQTDTWVPLIMLGAGVSGAVLAFTGIHYLVDIEYLMNIGGKPRLPWPMWIPVTFEVTVLLSALTGIAGMFALNGLPAPYHPLFDAPGFDRVTNDKFFLCIEASDPKFDPVQTREFLASLGALQVSAVELRK